MKQKRPSRLAPIFSDGAVLPYGRPVTVFGTGDEPVQLTHMGKTYEAVHADGRFFLTLPPTPPGGPYDITVTLGARTQVLRSICFGEVILLAGQSNAELPMAQTDFSMASLRACPRLRVYFAAQNFAENCYFPTPLDDRWVTPTEDTVPTMPALAYHVGLRRAEAHGLPVGIVCVVRGASVIQSFMPEEAQAALVFSPEELSGAHPCNTQVERYRCYNRQGVIYRRMLEPLLPLSVDRVIWYQGESNTGVGESARYDALLRAMIDCWRQALGDRELPFVIVRIHEHSDSQGWRQVQAAQERAARDIPHCVLVSLASLGYDANIHPVNKEAVADLILEAIPPVTVKQP